MFHRKESYSSSREDIRRFSNPKIDGSMERYRSHVGSDFKQSNEKIERLTKDNNRLRSERNRCKDELTVVKNENKELIKKLTNKIQDLEQNNKNLNEEVIRLRTDCEQKGRKYFDLDKKYSEFGKQVEDYKQRRKQEFDKMTIDLDSEKKNKKFIEDKNQLLIKQKEELIKKLNDEKKKNINSVNSQSVVNDLKLKINAITRENNGLKNRLNEELNKSGDRISLEQDVKDLKETVDDLIQRLEIQVNENWQQSSNHKNEVLKLKTSYNSQITALKKQRLYFQNCNEMNKRKHLATQYLHVGHEKMYRKNVKTIHQSNEKNTNQVFTELTEEIIEILKDKNKKLKVCNTLSTANVIRDNVANSEEIYKRAKRVAEKNNDNSVLCPVCDRSFEGITNLKAHLRAKHFIRFDSSFDNPIESDSNQSRIIDSIDLSDD